MHVPENMREIGKVVMLFFFFVFLPYKRILAYLNLFGIKGFVVVVREFFKLKFPRRTWDKVKVYF
jgi:hypothetical protein